MIYEHLKDHVIITEDWSNGCWKCSLKYFLNAAMVRIRDLFQKHLVDNI